MECGYPASAFRERVDAEASGKTCFAMKRYAAWCSGGLCYHYPKPVTWPETAAGNRHLMSFRFRYLVALSRDSHYRGGHPA